MSDGVNKQGTIPAYYPVNKKHPVTERTALFAVEVSCSKRHRFPCCPTAGHTIVSKCVQHTGVNPYHFTIFISSGVCLAYAVTRYGLDGLGIESWWGRDLLHPSRPALWPTQLPIHWVPAHSRGKADGTWHWPPTPTGARVKEREELYLYSPSGPLWPLLVWNLPSPFIT